MQSPNTKNATFTFRTALEYIVKNQQPNGGFVVTSRSTAQPAPRTVELIAQSLLLDVLHDAARPEVEPITNRLARYLAHELSQAARANYAGLDAHALFYTLAVVHEQSDELITPAMLAAAVHYLIENEIEPGGPYRNALDASKRAELTTNISISRFLHRIGGPFPKLTSYIAQHYTPTTRSRYYTTAWPLQLQASRIASSAPIQPDWLYKVEVPTGNDWEPLYVCKDPHGDAHARYGSPVLTAALALAGTSSPQQPTTASDDQRQFSTHGEYGSVADTAHHIADQLPPVLATSMHATIERIVRADIHHEIGPLAMRFADALTGQKIPDTTLRTLGAANLFNWAAYTIYDDLIDEEGEPIMISTANAALRRAVALFAEAVPGATFAELVAQTYDTIDAANAWEIDHCRFTVRNGKVYIRKLPDYADLQSLCERSLSHSLPVVGVLIATGVAVDDPTVRAALAACKRYLVIRQLSDDLKDWREDLRAGHISCVVAQLLRDAEIAPGPTPLEELITQLESTFWRYTMPTLSNELLKHAQAAYDHLALIPGLAHDNVIRFLVERLEKAAHQMLAEQQNAKSFLKAYHKS